MTKYMNEPTKARIILCTAIWEYTKGVPNLNLQLKWSMIKEISRGR